MLLRLLHQQQKKKITETFGIPNTNAFTNSRGDNEILIDTVF